MVSVIARGLRAILSGDRLGELEVVVACNGCTDRTADIARSFGPPVHILEIQRGRTGSPAPQSAPPDYH